ncbi:hypothetical protein HaLaN_02013 [Haematococcus lacustris]|uniref:Uncharacterized protein n=1 Tax=Haematococcus lacustris TaxID=44745 RepID=A0A699YAN2_HAELA|nr:hypothetical protein HaLaN_02013 [Haematococcus lacustris]
MEVAICLAGELDGSGKPSAGRACVAFRRFEATVKRMQGIVEGRLGYRATPTSPASAFSCVSGVKRTSGCYLKCTVQDAVTWGGGRLDFTSSGAPDAGGLVYRVPAAAPSNRSVPGARLCKVPNVSEHALDRHEQPRDPRQRRRQPAPGARGPGQPGLWGAGDAASVQRQPGRPGAHVHRGAARRAGIRCAAASAGGCAAGAGGHGRDPLPAGASATHAFWMGLTVRGSTGGRWPGRQEQGGPCVSGHHCLRGLHPHATVAAGLHVQNLVVDHDLWVPVPLPSKG